MIKMDEDYFLSNETLYLNQLYKEGPISFEMFEFFSAYKYLYPQQFSLIEKQVLVGMGLFYKPNIFSNENIDEVVFENYSSAILDSYGKQYTPVQGDIKSSILNNKFFCFSAPTSIGKSFVLRDVIYECDSNVVVIVPSRALINEYIMTISDDLLTRDVRDYNVLQFVEEVNTKYTTKTIFVLTPERALELLKNPQIGISLFVFDEAQIIDKSNKTRSLKYRLLLEKISKLFPESKKLFAYPFVENVDCLVDCGLIKENDCQCKKYEYKSVGQMFVEYDENKNEFSIFSINKDKKVKTIISDPIINALQQDKTILIYTTKSKIYNGDIYTYMQKYISLCKEVTDNKALELIELVRNNIGDDNNLSIIVDYMKKGIVIHHGSLPQTVRRYIEEFIRLKNAKICIATTTLLQGINMPFDVIYLYEMYHLSSDIDFKNLIGRAGRSSKLCKYDYGIIITRNKAKVRDKVCSKVYVDLSNYEEKDEDQLIVKKSIEDGTFNEEYSIPNEIVEKLTRKDIVLLNTEIASILFDDNGNIKRLDSSSFDDLFKKMCKVYSANLHNRELNDNEINVFKNAILIMYFKFLHYKFSKIVAMRYDRAKNNKWQLIQASTLPDKKLIYKNVFYKRANERYYFDLVVYDTYEFIDTVFNLSIKDTLLASAQISYNTSNDFKLRVYISYLKYCSFDEDEVLLFKYGFDDEEIEEIKPHIYSISQECIIFKRSIKQIDALLYKKVLRYIYDDNIID